MKTSGRYLNANSRFFGRVVARLCSARGNSSLPSLRVVGAAGEGENITTKRSATQIFRFRSSSNNYGASLRLYRKPLPSLGKMSKRETLSLHNMIHYHPNRPSGVIESVPLLADDTFKVALAGQLIQRLAVALHMAVVTHVSPGLESVRHRLRSSDENVSPHRYALRRDNRSWNSM